MPKQIPDDIQEIEKRVSELKEKYKKEETRDKTEDSSLLFVGLRLGVEFASGTIIGASIGYILDEIFDFRFIMLLILTILGGFAGMLNAYRYMKSIDEKK